MRISVRLFAGLRERAGSDHVELDLPDDARAADVLAAMGMQPGQCIVALDREYAPPDAPIRADQEVAPSTPPRSLQDVAGLAWSMEAYHPEPARSWPRLQRWAATSHRPGWESTHNAIPSNGSPAATARRKASAVSQWVILSWSTEACRDGGGGVGLEWISDYIQYYSIHHPPSYTAHKPTHATTDSVGSSAVLH